MEVFDWLKKLFRIRRYISPLEFVPVLLVLVGLQYRFNLTGGYAIALFAALALHPPFLAGAWLYLHVLGYHRSVRRSHRADRGDPEKARRNAKKAYQRLRKLDQACDRLGSKTLEKGLLVGHHAYELHLRVFSAPRGLNTVRTAEGERRAQVDGRQRVFLSGICKFVRLSASPVDGNDQEVFNRLLSMIPDDSDHRILIRILESTYSDGEGILTTLLGLYQTHFVLSASPAKRATTLRSLNELTFETDHYGWVSTRLLQAVFDGIFHLDSSAEEIVCRLQPSLDRASRVIARAGSPSEMLEQKYKVREVLLAIVAGG